MSKKFILILLLPFVLFSSFLFTSEQEHLHSGDIHKVMQQIFAQHVEKKRVDGEILTRSFKVYFEQFDPQGIYLLQSESAPFVNMDEEQLKVLEKQYVEGDYAIYRQMNDVVQNAISRSQAYRQELEKNQKALFKEALTQNLEDEKNSAFAENEQALQKRMRLNLLGLLQEEVRRFGEKGIAGYEKEAIALIERDIRAREAQYAYQNLPQEEQENLFTLHVLKSLAKSLDAHTAFFDSQEAYDLRVRLEKGFDGIGLVFQESPQGIVVAHLLEGSPASKDGNIKVGDRLLEINGFKTSEISFEQVMDLLRGKKDEPVALVFTRTTGESQPQKTIQVNLKREPIMLNEDRIDIASEKFGNGIIGVITLHSFYQNDKGVTSEKDVRDAIERLKREGPLKGLILDLRENGGGFLSQAVKVAGLFVTNGIIVISKYYNGDEKIYRDIDSGVEYTGPFVILTSKATASAAEIVAQALQDYGVAIIVGDEHTYGKGTIQSQTVTGNNGNSYFKVTVGEYYTVSGKTPQLHGVLADVVVPGPYSNAHIGEEYLEDTIQKSKTIPDLFNDQLQDVPPDLKPWFLRYYLPHLQQKKTVWRDMIPGLQKNSERRLAENKNYQLFLKKLAHPGTSDGKDPDQEERRKEGNFGMDDFQLSEGLNVVKDMIYLDSKMRQREYGGVQQ
jgi:carboxyl-terminal processing protease